MSRARTLYDAGAYAEALETLRAVDGEVRAAGDHPSFRWAVARCHEHLGELDAAAEAYRAFIAIAPDAEARRRAEARLAPLTERPPDPPSDGRAAPPEAPPATPSDLRARVAPTPEPSPAAEPEWRFGGRVALLSSGITGEAPRWQTGRDLGFSVGVTAERPLTSWLRLSGALLWNVQRWQMEWNESVEYEVAVESLELQGVARLDPGAGRWWLAPHALVGLGLEGIYRAASHAAGASAREALDVRPIHAVAHLGFGVVPPLPWDEFEMTITARAALAMTTLGAGEARVVRLGIGAGFGF